jgi:hypothetical protein
MDRAQRRRHPIAAGRGRVRSLPSGAGIPFEEIEEPRSHKLNAIAYPSLDGLTAKGATEEQRSPDSKRPTRRGWPKCLFQLVAGVRNWSWQHRENKGLWCPSSSTWAIASRAGRSRRRNPADLTQSSRWPVVPVHPTDRCRGFRGQPPMQLALPHSGHWARSTHCRHRTEPEADAETVESRRSRFGNRVP